MLVNFGGGSQLVGERFLEYMESGRAVRVGMVSHMGPEMRSEPEPEREGMLDLLLRKILGLPAR